MNINNALIKQIIEAVRASIKEEFDALNERMASIEKRLENVEHRLDDIGDNLENIEARLSALEVRLIDVDGRVKTMHSAIMVINEELRDTARTTNYLVKDVYLLSKQRREPSSG